MTICLRTFGPSLDFERCQRHLGQVGDKARIAETRLIMGHLGSGLYGGGLYGGTIPTYDSTADFSQNADSTAEHISYGLWPLIKYIYLYFYK